MVPAPSTVKTSFLSHLFGGSATVWLYGATCLQVHQYYNNFGSSSDKFLLKFSVAFIFTLETLHVALLLFNNYLFYAMYIEHKAYVSRAIWTLAASIYIGIAITWTVNQFFIHRIYILSEKNLRLCVVLSILAAIRPAFGFAVVVVIATMVSHGGRNLGKQARWIMITEVATEVIIDGLIAICVSYFLLRGRNKAVASTRGIINTLLKYTLQTGVILMIFASLELIEVVHWARTGSDTVLFVSTAIFHVQVQLYANCFLTMLNARHEIRHRMENSSVVIMPGQPSEREA